MFGPGVFASAVSDLVATCGGDDLVDDLIRERWPTGRRPMTSGCGIRRGAAREAARKELRLDDCTSRGGPHTTTLDRAFETQFAPDIERLVARFHRYRGGAAPTLAREAVRRAREDRRVLRRRFLQNWLRVTAARLFVDAARSDVSLSTRTSDEKELVGRPRRTIRAWTHRDQLGGAVKHAFAAAVRACNRASGRSCGRVCRSADADQIAATYGVHRATVARTLASAREHLIERTRADVARQLGVEVDDLASAIGVLATNLEFRCRAAAERREAREAARRTQRLHRS